MKIQGGALRSRLTVAGSLALVTAVVGATLTNAAWVDDEYVHAGVGTDGRCEQDSGTVSSAAARQLSGSLLKSSLDELVSLQGVRLSNDGEGTTTASPGATRINDSTYLAPLDVNVSGVGGVSISTSVGAPVGSAALYSQWGQTLNNGNTTAASGLVTDSSGAMSLGEPNNGSNPPTMATINLGELVPQALAGVMVEVGAASSLARVTQCGDLGNGWLGPLDQPLTHREYRIASLDLTTALPALGTAVTSAGATLDGVQSSLDASQAGVALSITQGLGVVAAPLLGSLTQVTSTSVKMSPADFTPVKALLTGTMTDRTGLLTVDFTTGTVRANLAQLTGGANGLNGMAPNTQLVINQAMVDQLSAALVQVLTDWRQNLTAALVAAVRATTVEVASTVRLSSAGIEVAEIKLGLGPAAVGQLLDLHHKVPGTAAVPVTTSVAMLGLDSGGLLGTTLGSLTATVNSLAAALAAELPGVTGKALQDEAINGVIGSVDASVSALAGPVQPAYAAALKELHKYLSVLVNVQPDQPGYPSLVNSRPTDSGPLQVSALRLTVLNGNVQDLSLATSAVGYAGCCIS